MKMLVDPDIRCRDALWGVSAYADSKVLTTVVPTAMIFDDHDIRDDWNTSQSWREEMAATDWWHDRIVGGLAFVLLLSGEWLLRKQQGLV